VLASGPGYAPAHQPPTAAGAAAGASQADTTVTLGQLAPLGDRLRMPRARIALGPLAGPVALAMLVLSVFTVVLFSSATGTVLVPRSYMGFPHWESGPLHHLFGALTRDVNALNWGWSAIVVAMLIPYAIVLAVARQLSMRTIAIAVVVMEAILLLGPPLQLSDLFNYLGYARLGGLHHLNPYTHVIANASHDPVFRFSSWHHLRSPYGPLFTALTYPLAFVSVPVAYWILKVVTVLLSLTFIWLVWFCARKLGRDPRFPVLFVAANPIFLLYAVGGFHNDFFMLVPSIGAIALVLDRRDRAAGAVLMLAVAVKFTAILLLPFLLIAVVPSARRIKILSGAALAAVPLAAMSFALFGTALPNLVDQSTLLTNFSVPNFVGDLIGIGGGTPALLRVANVALAFVVLWELRRRKNWIAGAGWATIALIASLAWLMPWYIIWALPLAALGSSVNLRRACLVFTVYLVLTFIPATGIFLYDHGFNPMGGSAGQASTAKQNKLQ
jgi:hypothetical protein